MELKIITNDTNEASMSLKTQKGVLKTKLNLCADWPQSDPKKERVAPHFAETKSGLAAQSQAEKVTNGRLDSMVTRIGVGLPGPQKPVLP
ncbi:MAG: hypothetical protein ABSH52_09040 [Terriglobia bacterium]|jgi:hypothetical protein